MAAYITWPLSHMGICIVRAAETGRFHRSSTSGNGGAVPKGCERARRGAIRQGNAASHRARRRWVVHAAARDALHAADRSDGDGSPAASSGMREPGRTAFGTRGISAARNGGAGLPGCGPRSADSADAHRILAAFDDRQRAGHLPGLFWNSRTDTDFRVGTRDCRASGSLRVSQQPRLARAAVYRRNRVRGRDAVRSGTRDSCLPPDSGPGIAAGRADWRVKISATVRKKPGGFASRSLGGAADFRPAVRGLPIASSQPRPGIPPRPSPAGHSGY